MIDINHSCLYFIDVDKWQNTVGKDDLSTLAKEVGEVGEVGEEVERVQKRVEEVESGRGQQTKLCIVG